ncbi:MAG TPA: YdcF family protein [Hyphomicrobiaceae bacterium]|nr:YdcF family protein [Hyphomicrobiaceae bacterium]
MARTGRLICAATGLALLAFLGGFIVFAGSVTHDAPRSVEHADGIVVLTGGPFRLPAAARLLAAGFGSRLLISGVNHMTTRDDLFRNSGLAHALFDCCVDIGYSAHDTSGNANEAKEWVDTHRFARLIVVTSSYHMPRSLTELGRALPQVALIPYPVVPRSFRAERWWLHAGSLRLLFTEYLKFLPSAARLGVARLLRQWDSHALAGGRAAAARSI